MAPTLALTDHHSLVAVLQAGIGRFSNGFTPLETLEHERLSKAVAVVREDPNTIVGNNYRKKSRRILVKLLSISFEVFFLCAIGTTLYAISKLRWKLRCKPRRTSPMGQDTFVDAVSNWWQTTPKPVGLALATERYAARLPRTRAPPGRPENLYEQATEHHSDRRFQGGETLTMPLHNLLDFLKDRCTDAPVQIHCPFDVRGPPSVQFGSAEWGMRMAFGLGIAKAVMEHGMQS